MTLERWIRLIAGTLIVASVALSYLHSPMWLWFTLFLGVSLFQSSLTGWCPMEDILRKFGVGQVKRAHLSPGAGPACGCS